VFKQYYIPHQLAQLDMGITNAGILYFEAHPELKKQRRAIAEIKQEQCKSLYHENINHLGASVW
jgi:hypothetical protein